MKIYCIVSRDALNKMGGNRGKLTSQTGHAFVNAAVATLEQNPDLYSLYKSMNEPKITLIAEDQAHLESLQASYQDVCPTHLVTDAAKTVFIEPTVTCLGIGVISQGQLKDDLKNLKVFI